MTLCPILLKVEGLGEYKYTYEIHESIPSPTLPPVKSRSQGKLDSIVFVR